MHHEPFRCRCGFLRQRELQHAVVVPGLGGRFVDLLTEREDDRVGLEFLELVSEHVAIGMENATLHLSLLEKDRMQRELADMQDEKP